MIGTEVVGPTLNDFPMRLAYPAVAIKFLGRTIGVYDPRTSAQEPGDDAEFGPFLAKLAGGGARLLKRLDGGFGYPISDSCSDSIAPLLDLGKVDEGMVSLPAVGSTAATLTGNAKAQFILEAPHLKSAYFLIATGSEWFYKTMTTHSKSCIFHSHERAHQEGVAEASPHPGPSLLSFTEAGKSHHCANGDFLASRRDACRIRAFETHLCCFGCIYREPCWQEGVGMPACPPQLLERVGFGDGTDQSNPTTA